ncbi:MAG: hypothetical protein RIB93_31395 [Coleofasciculus sp. D1-CHI-01]|uniref:hypothetical protein n=1 Tax=Coleofasciculus sp. D1-CHI-01 TaxID=3068482 RepID=UPI0032F5A31E
MSPRTLILILMSIEVGARYAPLRGGFRNSVGAGLGTKVSLFTDNATTKPALAHQ